MIYGIEASNQWGEHLNMVLSDPASSGMNVSRVSGITPGEAVFNTNEFAGIDGEFYGSSKYPGRDIVLTIRPWNEPSVEENRQRLYRFFPLQKQVRLMFRTDQRSTYIDGYVTHIEGDIFSEMEEIAVTVRCMDPYFRPLDSYADTINMTNCVPLFHFVYSNPEGTKETVFGQILDNDYMCAFNRGDADSFCDIYLDAHNTNFSFPFPVEIESTTIGAKMIIKDPGGTFKQGAALHIVSRLDIKRVYLEKSGKASDITKFVDPTSSWFRLGRGNNFFTFKINGQTLPDTIEVRLVNDTVYEGV